MVGGGWRGGSGSGGRHSLTQKGWEDILISGK